MPLKTPKYKTSS